MIFDEVMEKVPQLKNYLINMPKELKNKFRYLRRFYGKFFNTSYKIQSTY